MLTDDRIVVVQERIQEFANGGGGPSHSIHIHLFSPFPLFLHSLLELRPPKPAKESGGALQGSPIGVRGGAPAENEFGAL